MITHYLKVALRNLLKHKTHSLISALCLAIGIVAFSLTYLFVTSMSTSRHLPNYEHRASLWWQRGDETRGAFTSDDLNMLSLRLFDWMDTFSAYSSIGKTEVDVITQEGMNMPYQIDYRLVNKEFYSFYNMELLYGPQLPVRPDEIVITQTFADKMLNKENPIGKIVQLTSLTPDNGITNYKIVNVVSAIPDDIITDIDCFFPLEMDKTCSISLNAYITSDETVSQVNQALKKVVWEQDGESAFPQVTLWIDQDRMRNTSYAQFIFLFCGSLILISSLINFLKFTFQMFYARQRELALRKCVGSNTKGLFLLLFAEVFLMLSFAFVLSLIVAEVLVSFAKIYLPDTGMGWLSLTESYKIQFSIYFFMLFVCLFLIIYPIWRVHKVSIINQLHIHTRKHLFRSFMIGLQLVISFFFLGGIFIVHLSYNELLGNRYEPLNKSEEKQIITIDMSTQRIRDNWDAIRAEIGELPEIIEYASIGNEGFNSLFSYTYIPYSKPDGSTMRLAVGRGSSNYFDFFHIPMKGKAVANDNDNYVYINKNVADSLSKENMQGNIILDGKQYQIAGIYENLYNDITVGSLPSESVFFPTRDIGIYLLKVSPSHNADQVKKKVEAICRKYVPQTLPLNISTLNNKQKTIYALMYAFELGIWILAIVSLLLVSLSIYSSISMDAVQRQKEVAIRKINGARPSDIAMQFAKLYILLFLIAFILAYPILRLAMIASLEGSLTQSVYGWEWGVMLFIVIASVITISTAWQIKRIMRLNPADVIRKE